MDLPSIAPFPPQNIRSAIPPSEWKSSISAWIAVTKQYLLAGPEKFRLRSEDDSSVVKFLITYYDSVNHHQDDFPNSKVLSKQCFLLVHRILSNTETAPPSMLDWGFLSNLSLVHVKSSSLSLLLYGLWHSKRFSSLAFAKASKAKVIALLERTPFDLESGEQVTKVAAFSRTCPPYGQYLMAGSDFIDCLVLTYDQSQSSSAKEKVLFLAYMALASLMDKTNPQSAALLDHLYGLRSTSLLEHLIRETPFFTQLGRHFSQNPKDNNRALPLLKRLSQIRRPSKSVQHLRRRADKGKGKALADSSIDNDSGLHVHKMSLVSQIRDLFPDLGSGFIIRLLDEYDEDTEQITAQLLDDRLPPHLEKADRSEVFKLPIADDKEDGLAAELVPHGTPPLPPTRRNVHDNDDFDNLAIDASKIHLGRKNKDLTADKMLAADRPSERKAAILSALAAFDSDDDERDDTYDVEDVGGTVDTTYGGEETDKSTSEKTDEELYKVYKTTPDLFKRDPATRMGQPRASLKKETGMTDEAIEGWAIMLGRDPAKQRRLERGSQMNMALLQPTLEATAWKADSGTEGTEDSDAGNMVIANRGGIPSARGRGGGRGRGRGNRGPVTKPSGVKDTQIARQRKDANKASRANHNRRDQRAKKMTRGGFPG